VSIAVTKMLGLDDLILYGEIALLTGLAWGLVVVLWFNKED